MALKKKTKNDLWQEFYKLQRTVRNLLISGKENTSEYDVAKNEMDAKLIEATRGQDIACYELG